MSATVEMPTVSPVTPRNQTKRTIRNLAHVVGGEAMLRVANFVAAIVIARVGGAATFGIYATTLAYATVASIIADNGLGITTVRRIGSSPDQLNELYTQYAVSKTVLFVPMVVVLAAIGWIAHLTAPEWIIGALIVWRTVLQGYCQMQVTVLKAIDRMQAIGAIQAIHSLALLLALLGCYLRGRNIYAIIVVLVAAQCVELAMGAAWIHRIGVRLVQVGIRECWRMLHGSTAVGVTFSLSIVIPRIDVIVLSSIVGAAAAGIFAAAQTILVIVYLLSYLLASVLFPQMARLAHTPEELQQYFCHWSGIILSVIIPGTVLAITVGPRLVRVLFGEGFHGSGSLLAIMLTAAPLIVMNSLYLHRAFALNQMSSYLGIYVTTAGAGVLLDAALARSFGPSGIAVAVVLREFLVLCAFWLLRNAGRPLVSTSDTA